MKHTTRALSSTEIQIRHQESRLIWTMRMHYQKIRAQLDSPLVDETELFVIMLLAGLVDSNCNANVVRSVLSSRTLDLPVAEIEGETRFFFPFVLDKEEYGRMHMMDLIEGTLLRGD